MCDEGDAWRGVLSRVVARESRLGRGGIAAVLALGRCGREEVLRGLAALVADPSTRRDLEGALAVSLGQVRNPEGTPQDGGTGRAWLGIGDATLGAPIPETYVVEALLQLMSSGPPERGGTPKDLEEDPRLSAVHALAGTAGVRQDVFDQLLAIAATDPDVAVWLRSSLGAAGQAPWVAAWARKEVVASGDDDPRLREKTMAWIAAGPEEAAHEIAALLRDAAVSPQRKARMLSGTHVGVGVAESTVEDLLRAADAFATAHPTVVVGRERSGMEENAPMQDILEDVRFDADRLILNAAGGPRGGSTVVRDLALEAALRTIRGEDPDGGRIRPPRRLAFVFERGEALTLLVLARLPGAGLDPERLADCLDAALESPAARGVASASIRAAVERAAATLPADVRAAWEPDERRAPTPRPGRSRPGGDSRRMRATGDGESWPEAHRIGGVAMPFVFELLLSGAIIGLVIAVLERSAFPGWPQAIGCALGIGLATAVCGRCCRRALVPGVRRRRRRGRIPDRLAVRDLAAQGNDRVGDLPRDPSRARGDLEPDLVAAARGPRSERATIGPRFAMGSARRPRRDERVV